MYKKLITLLIVLMSFNSTEAIAKKDYIPEKAFKYKKMICQNTKAHFKNIPDVNYIPSLIEHESCIYLTHKKCWNPGSRLKTKREEGIGLGQLTRAYRKDGSIRFDSLTEIKNRHKSSLNELNWNTVSTRPDLQIRVITLMLQNSYKQLYKVTDGMERLAMTDAAYNGGLRGVFRERRACNLAANCDRNIWFGNVERYCLKSKKILYGKRNACMINRHHVIDVMKHNLPKYRKGYFVKKNNK